MAVTKTYLATDQSNWARATPDQADLFTQAPGALSAAGGYAHEADIWGSSVTTPVAVRLVVSGTTLVPAGNGIAWKFYSTAAADETGEAKIWGISKLGDGTDEEFMAEFLVHLDLTVGLTETFSGNILPTGRFIDTITMKEDRSVDPGARVISNAENGVAALLLDGFGYMGYIIEMAQAPAASGGFGALYRTL